MVGCRGREQVFEGSTGFEMLWRRMAVRGVANGPGIHGRDVKTTLGSGINESRLQVRTPKGVVLDGSRRAALSNVGGECPQEE